MSIRRTICTFALAPAFLPPPAGAGNWITVGGNSLRNGLSNDTGPASPAVLWTKPSPASLWGNQIMIFGEKLVTTRYVSLSPIRAILACHRLATGDTLWTRNYAPNGVMILMGFNNAKIYARNFQQQGYDTIYAINPDDGSVLWKSRWTVERGIIWSAAFADNGDLFLPGSGTRTIMRISHLTGDTVWTCSRTIPNTGAECLCVAGSTLYAWEGSLTTPKRIIALNANTGAVLFSSAPLPGDGDQEIPFSVGPNHTIYAVRDGGSIHALLDIDTGFAEVWRRPTLGAVGTYSQIAVGTDTSVYIPMGKRVYRLDPQSGTVIDSSEELISSGTMNARFAVDSTGRVYVGNGASVPAEGRYYALTRNLQTVWSVPAPYNYYCGPALGGGVLVFCGGGTEITAYRNPSSDVSRRQTLPGAAFLDQSHPNPFNAGTVIRYELRTAGRAQLSVFDACGKLATTLLDADMQPGSYAVRFEPRNSLSSGAYFYCLTAGSAIQTKKFILLK